MSEIEKMYENCGIEIPLARLKIFKDDNGEIFTRPPFTAEKQLELLCFLINFGVKITMQKCNIPIKAENIANNLAGITNEIWQDLSDKEKEEIRGILK